jgi:hypothetical protein
MEHKPNLELLVGMTISHVWLGFGSALFLELGILTEGRKRKDDSVGNPKGEITIMVDYDWRIEGNRSILGGSQDSRKRCISISKKLLQTSVISAQLVGRIPELQLQLSNGLWVVTFSHQKGQPSWAILFSALGLGSLGVERGKLKVDSRQNDLSN